METKKATRAAAQRATAEEAQEAFNEMFVRQRAQELSAWQFVCICSELCFVIPERMLRTRAAMAFFPLLSAGLTVNTAVRDSTLEAARNIHDKL